MSDYNTGNPVPSIDPRDLDDNATNLDNLVNGVAAEYADRLGVMRKSYAGMEADIEELLDNPNLAAFAALVGVADRLPYFTGAGALSLATLTAQARLLLAGADSAAMRTTLEIPWAGAANATVAADLNAITTTGVFGISSGTLNLPPVAASGSMVLSLVFSSTNMQQIVTSRTSDQVYYRRLSGGVWGTWTSFVMAGANSTITSLTGLTTALSVAQGGTGVTTTAALLAALVTAGAASSVGVTDASNAAAGRVGEFVTANAAAVSLTNNTAVNLTSLALSAGDWEVWGVFEPTPAGAGQPTTYGVGVNTVSAVFPSYDKAQLINPAPSLFRQVMASPRVRVNVSSATTVYLVGYATFSSGTVTAAATINARRMR